MLLALAVVSGVVLVVRWRREPRRLSNGVWAVLAIGFALLAGAALGGPFAWVFGTVLFVLMLAAVLSLPVAAAFLIGNGLVMLRRERPTPGNLIGLVVGIGLVGVIVLTGVLLTTGWTVTTVVAVWLALVVSYFAFVFVCFAAFCLLYARRRRRRPVEAVVVLGSGVPQGRVPPLLAARLARAVEVRAEHAAAGWPLPVLVPSGGQGPDEIEPEAESMARWLRDHDVPADQIVVEPRARTTEENLTFSAEVVAQRRAGHQGDRSGAERPSTTADDDAGTAPDRLGALPRTTETDPAEPAPEVALPEGGGDPVRADLLPTPGSLAVVTNDYHAFRAALQARRLGLDANAVGAPTASYFVPSAYLREFVAVLREHWWVHLVMVLAITVGLGALTWNLVWMSVVG